MQLAKFKDLKMYNVLSKSYKDFFRYPIYEYKLAMLYKMHVNNIFFYPQMFLHIK